MGKRGQFSVEYMMIVAISLMILLPGAYIFRNYAFESNDRLIESRLTEVANSILLRAKKMHYFGPPSKSVVEVEMPPGIGAMYIYKKGSEHLLGFIVLTSAGEKEFLFESDFPLRVGDSAPCGIAVQTCDGCLCRSDPTSCRCFSENTFGEGLKNIKVESGKDTEFYVMVNESSEAVANG
jgi:hypothetical protein